MEKQNPLLVFLGLIWLLIRIFYYFSESLFFTLIPGREKDIKNKVVVLTGAGAGIGRELAIRLAKKGATLALWDIHREGVEETALMAREYGITCRAYVCDVSQRRAVLETAQRVKHDLGEVEVLFNNAGILIGGSITELSEKDITKTLAVNTLAHFWTLQAFLPSMMERDAGHIVTTASIAAKVGTPYLSAYCVSKWAAYGLAESLKAEVLTLGKSNIRSTTVCPLFVNTNLINNQPRFRPTFKFGKILEPEDVADAIMTGFLRNQDIIHIPKNLITIPVIRETWPLKAQVALGQFLGSRFKDTVKEKDN